MERWELRKVGRFLFPTDLRNIVSIRWLPGTVQFRAGYNYSWRHRRTVCMLTAAVNPILRCLRDLQVQVEHWLVHNF